MTQVPINHSLARPFEPMAIYDAPEVLFSMAVDGELTGKGVRNAFFNPVALTQKEREGVADRLKDAAGRGRITNALVDIATNPWAWFFFITSPVGGSVLARGAGGFFRQVATQSAWYGEHYPFLKNLGFATPLQLLRGTAGGAVFDHVGMGIERMAAQEGRVIGRAYEDLMERHKFKSLDWRAAKTPEEGARMRRLALAIQAELEGLGRNVPFTRVSAKALREERKVVVHRDVRPAMVDQREIDRALDEFGARPLTDALRRAMKERFVRVFGDDVAFDATGAAVVSSEKVLRVYRSLNNRLFYSQKGPNKNEAVEIVRTLLGRDVDEALAAGKLTRKEFEQLVVDTFKAPIDHGNYFPRNVAEVIDRNGKGLPWEEVIATHKGGDIGASKRAMSRGRALGFYHPDDLRMFDDEFGFTPTAPAMQKAVEKGDAILRDIKETGRKVTMLRARPQDAMARYFSDTARTYAWHVQDVPEDVHELAEIAFATMHEQGIEPRIIGTYKPYFWKEKGAVITKAVRGQEPPPGGFTLADVAWQTYALAQDDYVRRLMVDVLVPRVSGRLTVRHAATMAAFISAKQSMKALADGPVGRAIEGAGDFGKRFVEQMRQAARTDVALDSAGGMAGSLAKYLYVTHLGLNMSSVVLNLMQPMLLAATWLGAGPVLKGYTAAFREMGDYMQQRIKKYGLGAITDAERRELVQATFAFENPAVTGGESLMGISPNLFETIEGVTFAAHRTFQRPSRLESLLVTMMKPFEKAEWINRAVTAHAAAHAVGEGGGRALSPLGRRFVKEMVLETQFGGGVLNIPVALQAAEKSLTPFGRVGANPLMRQFLQFPLRSLTGILVTARQLGPRQFRFGGEVPAGWGAAAFDFARGMGLSAILYEGMKNVLGADMERALFFSATTDLIGERMFDRDGGPLPIPPVLDIPLGVAVAMASDDKALMARSLSRLLPSGVAIQRYASSMVKLPFVSAIQTNYVGWNNPAPDGRVPLYDAEGNLIDFRSPSEMIMKAMGVDLGSFREAGQLDRHLMSVRDDIIEARREYLTALVANDIGKANAVKVDFQRRHGLPLTVSRQQVNAFIRSREVPRTERILDRLPSDARPEYLRMVGASRGGASRLGLTEEQLYSAMTAKDRQRTELLTPEEKERAESAAFEPFTSF